MGRPCTVLNPVLELPRASTVVIETPSRLPKGARQELILFTVDSSTSALQIQWTPIVMKNILSHPEIDKSCASTLLAQAFLPIFDTAAVASLPTNDLSSIESNERLQV